jgi:hypothetical protein
MKLTTAKRIYDALNDTVFAGLLYRPLLCGTRNRYTYAAYEAGIGVQSRIYINSREIANCPVNGESFIYHEMIHQYLEEYLGIEESDHHGPEFWRNYRLFAPKGIILFEDLE